MENKVCLKPNVFKALLNTNLNNKNQSVSHVWSVWDQLAQAAIFTNLAGIFKSPTLHKIQTAEAVSPCSPQLHYQLTAIFLKIQKLLCHLLGQAQ